MSRLLLVRHGQASFGSQNYDQLSELGHQQARWLGAYLKHNDIGISHIISGNLARQIQTVEGILADYGETPPYQQNSDWNEFDFHQLGQRFLEQYPHELPTDNSPKAFFALLRKALQAWASNTIACELPESWQDFQARIGKALQASCEQATKQDTILVVSSGGAIAMAMQHVLALPNAGVIDLNLQTRNTGVTEIYFNAHRRYLTSFNAVPHLEHADRRSAITSA